MYIINKNTLYLHFDGENTLVRENDSELVFFNNFLNTILEGSCNYYGSSLKGRIKGSRVMLDCKYRTPIIISEKNSIIFFPIKGEKNEELIWFNFNMIKEYKREKNFIRIIFKNNVTKEFMISYTVFNNQMYKSSRLWLVYLTRV